MKAFLVVILCICGCEWHSAVVTQEPTIEDGAILSTDICGDWLRYDPAINRLDELHLITITLEDSPKRYSLSWREMNKLKVTAVTKEIKQDGSYALLEIEISDALGEWKAYRLAIIFVESDRLCLWWVMDKKLHEYATSVGVELELDSCFPIGTSVNCDRKRLLDTVLSNPAAVVGEAEQYYRRKPNNTAMMRSRQ